MGNALRALEHVLKEVSAGFPVGFAIGLFAAAFFMAAQFLLSFIRALTRRHDHDKEVNVSASEERFSQYLSWGFAAIGGLLGFLIVVFRFDRLLSFFGYDSGTKTNWNFPISPASAADSSGGWHNEVSSVVPYVAGGVIGLVGLAFIVALFTLLMLKDTKENQSRIKTAERIVMSFGGFFTGLAMALFK